MSSGSEGCLQGLGHGPGHWDLGDEGAPGMVLLQRGGLGAGAPSQGRPEAMARGASATPQVRRQQALEPRRGVEPRLFCLSCLRARGLRL